MSEINKSTPRQKPSEQQRKSRGAADLCLSFTSFWFESGSTNALDFQEPSRLQMIPISLVTNKGRLGMYRKHLKIAENLVKSPLLERT